MSDAIVKPLPYRVDLAEPIKKTYLDTIFATQDSEANRFDIALYKDKAQQTLPSGTTVNAYFIRYGDNITIPMKGSVNGNVVSVTLSNACYNKTGQFALIIKAVTSGVISTIFYGEGTVFASSTDKFIDPEEVIPSLDELLPRIEVIEKSIGQLSEQIVDNRVAKNLLLNSDWRIKKNIVNRRGQDSYIGVAGKDVYTIDGWVIPWQEGLVLTVGDGYLQKGNKLFAQRLPDSIDPTKTYTGALCLLDGTMFVYSGTPENGFGGWSESFFIGKDGGRYAFMLMDQMTQPMAWAALYEGEYTADNLPPYRPKGYANELLACEVAENGDVFSNLRQMVSDAWNSQTLYTVGDYCIYDNTLYRRKINASGAESEFVPEYWQAVTVANELKNRKEIKTKQVTATTDSNGFIQLISMHDAECVLQAKPINLNGFCYLYTHFFSEWFTAKCADWDGTVYANAQVTIVVYYI